MAQLQKTVFLFEYDYSNFYRKQYNAAEAEFLAILKSTLREKNSGDLVGEIIQWPAADSYAYYVVVKQIPRLVLAHVKMGDGWTVDPAQIRGLRIADARKMVEWRKSWIG
jgi:hypothetical protein